MSGKYASPFDALLADNKAQMDNVLGGASTAFASRPQSPKPAASPATPASDGDGTVLSGTAGGVPFQLKV